MEQQTRVQRAMDPNSNQICQPESMCNFIQPVEPSYKLTNRINTRAMKCNKHTRYQRIYMQQDIPSS